MANNATPLLTQGVRAQTALYAYQPITKNGTLAGAGELCIGFSTAPALPGSRCPVTVLGSAIAMAGGAIVSGSDLQVGAAGLVVEHSTGAIVGRAMNSASGIGDAVEVQVAPYGNLTGGANPVTGKVVKSIVVVTEAQHAALVAAGTVDGEVIYMTEA